MIEKRELNWLKIIDEYKKSRKTQKQFCKDNRLAYSTFSKKLNQNKDTNKKEGTEKLLFFK